MSTRQPFDAVLIVAFGGPTRNEDVPSFLANVVGGRNIPAARLDEVVRHYALFDGVSPIGAITARQADGLRQILSQTGPDLPVYVGMRCWHPFVADTLRDMADAGVRRAIGFVAAAHHCPAGCGRYKACVHEARTRLRNSGRPDIEVTYIESWFDHPGFIATQTDHIRRALEQLDPACRDRARIVFTAHSIPQDMASRCAYRQQLHRSARLVADELKRGDWALVYQSRSGRPADPWLEPDVCDYLRSERAKGLEAAVLVPIGFVHDHIEVLYDLDHAALGLCREIGLPAVRAETVNDDPGFVAMMADLVRETWDRYTRYPPLPIVGRGESSP